MTKKLQIDWYLAFAAIALTTFGLAMVYSASALLSLRESDGATQFAYFFKQLAYAVIGLILMFLATRFDYDWLRRSPVVLGLLGATFVCLLAVFAFPKINGAHRWIRLAGFSFQPSELAKITLAVYLAAFLARREQHMHDLGKTLAPSIVIFGLLAGLTILEPDLGTTLVLTAIFGSIYFVGGAKILHAALLGALCVSAAAAAVILAPWRMARIMAYRDPWADAENKGYQLIQSLLSLGSGGTWGEGYAQGVMKMHYLPYGHSDFIFAVIGEELGLIGCLMVLMVFGLFMWRGILAAWRAPDRFGKLLGTGIVSGITFQTLFNISVATGLVPTKGIPLPFISYGGSSLVLTLLAVGILLNISQYGNVTRSETNAAEKSKKRVVARRAAA